MNGIEIVKSNFSASNLNICGQRQDMMPTRIAPRKANITDDTSDSTAGNKHSEALGPDSIKLVEEQLVRLDAS